MFLSTIYKVVTDHDTQMGFKAVILRQQIHAKRVCVCNENEI